MFLIEVIPFARLPRMLPDTFTYFSSEFIARGAVVEIEVRQRKLLGMVLSAAPVKDAKQHLRTASFILKKVGKIVSDIPILNSRDWAMLEWISGYYLTTPATVLRMLVPSFAVRGNATTTWERREEASEPQPAKFMVFAGALAEKRYPQLVAEAVDRTNQVLIIAPEISRAAELLDQLSLALPREKLLVATSAEPAARLRQHWRSIRRGAPAALIGSRLPLFFPFVNLGLIIIDDDGAPAHKSWDQEPRYHAREIALKLHELYGGALCLSGNPPSLAAYQAAKTDEKAAIVEVPQETLTPVSLFVEMDKEIKESGNFVTISQVLKDKLRSTMMDRGRAFLFVNRKGFAPFVLCQDCGYVFRCDQCSVPLVYHAQESFMHPTLLCHHCSAKNPAPDVCRQCGSHRLKPYGIGGERVAKEIKKLFPGAPVITISADEAKRPADIKKLSDRLTSIESYIAVGTEMALSGARLPPVELAAIISVDTALALPDYAQNERLFRILSLIRAIALKHFIFQSYAKEPEILRDLFHGSFEHFAEKELKERRKFSYPPFGELVKLTIQSPAREAALKSAKELHRSVTFMATRLAADSVEISPPYPAYVEKKKGQFIFHILVKILKPEKSMEIKELLNQYVPGDIRIDVGPMTLL